MEPLQMAYSVQGESSSASLTSDSTPKVEYDVFLSFAGKNTRLKFADHLYEAFNTSGIKTFRDAEYLERGRDIKQNLIQAIRDSLCAVVIISENYAESSWCLDELQEILQSQKTSHRRVFPIFYDVDPSDVRQQTKSFGEAFAKHEERFIENIRKVRNWREALSEVGNLPGWDTRGMHEAELIKKIVAEVWTYLSSKFPSYDDNLVGIDSRVADMMSLLEIGLDDKYFVGVWGMGGVGKTTLARVVSEKISHKFEVCCFLANVREAFQREGLISLQKRLLSHLKIKDMEISDDREGMKIIRKHLCNKKVLLVLDDLDDMRQLKNLAESPNWFGKGSRIIITTRNSQLLISSRVDKQRIHEMKILKEDESLQLFSNKAFHKDHPEENYLESSNSVVKYAGGLPLALEVLGSFLCGRSEAEWRDTLDKLKKTPNEDILQKLRISYDALDEEENAIFLDIACFFNGWDKRKVILILKSCDLHPIIGINNLTRKALLVETKDGRLKMHDLLEELGRYMAHQESPNDAGKRSRLWKFEDIQKVLENNMGSEAIQAIVTDYSYWPSPINVHPEAFSKISNIRLLLVSEWINGPLILPKLTQLTYIELSNSKDLTETPDLSGVPRLKHLCLCYCQSLVTIHPSLGQLKELVEVHLEDCEILQFLPEKLEANSLIWLNLRLCEKVAALPEFGEGMKKLSYLNVEGTAITELPKSLGSLTGLRCLNLSGCEILNLDKLVKADITRPVSGLNVMSLTELYLSGCGLTDESVPDDFGSLSSLIVLDLSFNNFVNLPTDCFSSLVRLLFLALNDCERLKSLPRLPPKLIRLAAHYCGSMEPLSGRQLRDLVASLDHEYRGRSKYVIPEEEYEERDYNDDDYITSAYEHVELECLPLSDFVAIIPGSKIPSWFKNQEYFCPTDTLRGEYEIKVEIPLPLCKRHRIKWCHRGKWSGIIVGLLIRGYGGHSINWSTKAAEDDGYTFKKWAHFNRVNGQSIDMCIMALELNEETCWKHLRRSQNNSLHILFRQFTKDPVPEAFGSKIWGCGWRVICKETKLQPAYPDELNLPSRVLRKFFYKELGDR